MDCLTFHPPKLLWFPVWRKSVTIADFWIFWLFLATLTAPLEGFRVGQSTALVQTEISQSLSVQMSLMARRWMGNTLNSFSFHRTPPWGQNSALCWHAELSLWICSDLCCTDHTHTETQIKLWRDVCDVKQLICVGVTCLWTRLRLSSLSKRAQSMLRC